jgi:hypothetical protein
MNMISFLTINTHNSIKDLLDLPWTTLRTQHKMYVDFYNKQLQEEERLAKEARRRS